MTPKAAQLGCALLTWAMLPACGDVGQEHTSVPLFVAGTALEQPIVAAGDISVTVERAELAFGPLYLCSGFQAGELCDTARLEWLGSTTINLMDPVSHRAGALSGATGPVRSWMYDLGISSQLTRAEPFVLDAAAKLAGASLVVSGRASKSGASVAFRAEVVVQQGGEAERGVSVIRKSTSDAFEHDVTSHEQGLWVRFDAEPWIRSVDFASELETAGCVSAQDCPDSRLLEPSSPAYLGLHNAVVLGRRPSFSWSPPP